ncbi:hypothetical protein BD413DRAFT_494185 [Trametes elegans]|nr:hypothetical protein BD413DRAFT_494185 [Trametes elegans]
MSGMIKSILFLIASGAHYITMVPPNPPPKKEEMDRYDMDLNSRLSSSSPGPEPWYAHPHSPLLSVRTAHPSRVVQAFSWTLAAGEIAIILARDLQPAVGKVLLSRLLQDPSRAANVRPTAPFLLGAALLVFGAGLRKVCYRTLGRHFTFQLAVLKGHELVTSGPYAVVRHPSYTGWLASMAGMLLVQLAPGGWLAESGVLQTLVGKAVIGYWVGIVCMTMLTAVMRVGKEEAVLREEFKEKWDRWAKRTPYALIPYVC